MFFFKSNFVSAIYLKKQDVKSKEQDDIGHCPPLNIGEAGTLDCLSSLFTYFLFESFKIASANIFLA